MLILKFPERPLARLAPGRPAARVASGRLPSARLMVAGQVARLLSWSRTPRARRQIRWVSYGFIGLFVLVCADVLIGTPSPSQIRSLSNMPEATKVFDINGRLAFTVFKERRMAVPLAEVSPNVINAVLAIEDQRFYDHGGIDPWRIGGAFIANVREGEAQQGGSTITQQLARKSFLTDDKTIRRKLKEAFLAFRIERNFTKDQILELYLNKIYFGDGYYGIEAAARGYFNKPARDVTVDEAALLAGLIKAPSLYSPTRHLDRAVSRRAIVLGQMAEAGFIDGATHQRLAAAPVVLKDGFGHERSGHYFKNHITRLLIDEVGWERLSQGGLTVYSTIDTEMQIAAERAVVRGLETAEKSRVFKHPKRGDPRTLPEGQSPTYLQGALVAIDPANGEVRAMTGGRDFDESNYNRAVQMKRQAGSAFKPFVYAAALEAGYTPATLVTDLDAPMMATDGAWLPDDGHSSAQAMTVRTALRTSSNRAAVQVLRAVGIPDAVKYANRLGLEAPAVPSLVLGSGEVTVLSMASAYGVFVNGGWLHEPTFIRRVVDADGRQIFSSSRDAIRGISEGTAFLMAQMLADVVNRGTGYRAREAGFRFAAGGKTGTTNEYRDAWFVGFTPKLVTSVWVGFDQPKTIAPGGYAGDLAAPIWGRFMQDAAGKKDAGWVRRPNDVVAVEVCRLSGALPSDGCRRATVVKDNGEVTSESYVGQEFFRFGTEPVDECPIHGAGSYSGLRRSVIGSTSGISGMRAAAQAQADARSQDRLQPIGASAISASVPPASAASSAAARAVTAAVKAAVPAPAATPGTGKAAVPAAEDTDKKSGFFGRLKRIFGGRSDPAATPPPPPPAKPTGRGGGGGG